MQVKEDRGVVCGDEESGLGGRGGEEGEVEGEGWRKEEGEESLGGWGLSGA